MTCPTCDGHGTVIEFRRFAGEYMAGEPYEVTCPDCEGEPDDEQLTEVVSDPLPHLEPKRRAA